MGGELPPESPGATVPTFLVWARKDPRGANLDRIQIVKGWTYQGRSFERVYEVALSDEEIDYLGAVKLSAVEKMQQQIVDIIRRLEDAGEIEINTTGEEEQLVE